MNFLEILRLNAAMGSIVLNGSTFVGVFPRLNEFYLFRALDVRLFEVGRLFE